MNPRLPKIPFILFGVAVLAAGFILAKYGAQPLSMGMVVAIACCVEIGAALGALPFLTDYIAEMNEEKREHSAQVNAQIQRLHAAGESLSRAAAQIKSVEEAVHKSAHAAETLPYRMQEKLAEFNESLAEKEADDREALEAELNELRATNSDQLKAVADKIHKAGTDWAALEVATRKQLAAANDTTAGLEKKLKETLAQLDTKIAALNHAADAITRSAPPYLIVNEGMPTPALAPATVVKEEPKPEPIIEAAAVETTAATLPAVEAVTAEVSTPKPKKPRAPRKPKTEEVAAPAEPTATITVPAEIISPPATEPESSSGRDDSSGDVSSQPPAKEEASASSDGATRLLATAYIGIGNKLYVRGDGPGLSWDKGVAMQFVSIGKWGWATHDATAPIRVKLYKNDDLACLTGEIHLAPGRHVEATALF